MRGCRAAMAKEKRNVLKQEVSARGKVEGVSGDSFI
jgi:hypothetical protein